MKSRADLALLLLVAAAPASAQEPPAGDGPRGSSQAQPGELRYDQVGYAGTGDGAGASAAIAGLPAGSYAEVTALDTGRTIVVAVTDGYVTPGRVIALSGGAAGALGLTGDAPAVRVRKVTVTPQDLVLLREGRAASSRADAPPVLLAALRRKLPAMPRAVASRPKPVPKPKSPVTTSPAAAPKAASARPAATITSGYVVQVAALSSAERAAAVARAVGGAVIAGPPVWRVRLGPYPDIATATRAKADAARRGYAGGQITRLP